MFGSNLCQNGFLLKCLLGSKKKKMLAECYFSSYIYDYDTEKAFSQVYP